MTKSPTGDAAAMEAALKENDDRRININPDGSIFEIPSVEELETSERGKIAWELLQALHAHLPEDKRPTGWADLSDVQIQRMLSGAALITLREAAVIEARNADRELLVKWMMGHGFATGHSDDINDLLCELEPQYKERIATKVAGAPALEIGQYLMWQALDEIPIEYRQSNMTVAGILCDRFAGKCIIHASAHAEDQAAIRTTAPQDGKVG